VNAEIKEALTAFRRFHSAIEGKIAIYGSLAFFSLSAIECAISVGLAPRVHLPGTLEYKTYGLMKVPCKKGEPYPYGYVVSVTLPSKTVAWARVCRDFKDGGWNWDFHESDPGAKQ
jgi:hypothetical protein